MEGGGGLWTSGQTIDEIGGRGGICEYFEVLCKYLCAAF